MKSASFTSVPVYPYLQLFNFCTMTINMLKFDFFNLKMYFTPSRKSLGRSESQYK